MALAVAATLAGGAPVWAQRGVDDAIKVIDSLRSDSRSGSAAPVSFVPPPRTIKDITAILDQQKPDPAKAAAIRAVADAEPPANARKGDLAHFYSQRGLAAAEIGRLTQYRDDSRLAVQMAREAQITTISHYAKQLSVAETAAGDIRAALAANQLRLSVAQTGSAAPIHPMVSTAITHAQLGNIEEANRWLSRADGYSMNSGAQQVWGQITANTILWARATVQEMTGSLQAAETGYRRAIDTYERRIIPQEEYYANQGAGAAPLGSFPQERVDLLQNLARTLTRQGRLVEAESEARKALLDTLKRRGRYASQSGGAIRSLAAVIYEQGRHAEAEQLGRAALDIYDQIGVSRKSYIASAAQRQIAQAQTALGRWNDALETYDALKRDLESDDLLVGQFLTGNPDYAIVLLKAGKRDEALPILETVVGQRLKTLGDKAFAVAQARGWLAAGLAQAGQTQRALETFESAVPILLTALRQAEDAADDGASLAQNEQQTQQIVEAYLALLADTKGSAAAADAFRLADAVRGRSVQRALSASAARASVSDAALARLVRYEQDAQKQIAALQGLLANILTRPTSEQDANAVKKLREDIDRLRTSRARLREEIERRFPDYVNLIDPKPASVEQAQKSLRPGEALIATYAGSERLFVWAVPVQGAVSFAAAKVTDRDVETMVVGLRKALDPSADTLDAVPAFDVALANKLYDLLLKPVEAGWKDAKSLMVVPHKALGQLPTAVLVTEKVAQPAKAGVFFAEYKNVPFLARKVAVTQLPSVTSLATLRALPAPAANRATFVAFGDPWFSPEQASEARQQVAANTLQTRGRLVRRNAPKTEGVDSAELAQLPRLPDTAEEVRSIALALKADPVKDVFIGETANEKTVKTMDLSKRKIVMFATHGLVPGDLNGLTQPALAMTAPAVAKVDGDGLLTMEEVLALKLNADWVVLSACNTATGSGAGAEAVSGLGRAFFYAGTRALLVSNWPVETVSARTLTTDLFRRQAEDPKLARAEAMRQAEVALIDGPGALDEATRQPMFSYAHPIFWAPFSVVGDGG